MKFTDARTIFFSPQLTSPERLSTVIADNCAKADAYATAFMVTGLEQAIELCKADDIEAFFIYADDNGELQTFASDGFKKHIK